MRWARAVAVTFVAAVGLLTASPLAHADVLTTDFAMYQQVTTYGGARTVQDTDQRYRWIDTTPQNSRISYNFCSDYAAYQYNDFGAGFTSYKPISLSPSGGSGFYFTPGTCMVIRGRSLGTSFFNHDGSALY